MRRPFLVFGVAAALLRAGGAFAATRGAARVAFAGPAGGIKILSYGGAHVNISMQVFPR